MILQYLGKGPASKFSVSSNTTLIPAGSKKARNNKNHVLLLFEGIRSIQIKNVVNKHNIKEYHQFFTQDL